jgi:uncharacterized membrane protein YeaQ/YmgE (transglycosylase-associated protein family)
VRITMLVLFSPFFWAGRGSAQMSISGPAASVLFHAPQPAPLGSMSWEAPRDTVDRQIRPTYWKEGALMAGVVGAVGGAFLGHGLCEMSEEFGKNCTASLFLGGVLGAALLAVPGALIGGQFHKHQNAEADRAD